MKVAHDKQISRKHFEPNQRVYLYDFRLHLHPGKLRSRWTGLFMVRHVFLNSDVEIDDPTDGRTFTVNGQRLKSYVKKVNDSMYLGEIPLVDPVYRD